MAPNKKMLLQMKANNTQLQKELKALNKAEQINQNFHLANELQFRRKYEKYLTRGNFETSLLKKDGFKKVALQDKLSNLQYADLVPLHKLIYTNGEVDIEKVICLHLLSVHYFDVASLTGKRNLQLFPKRSKTNTLETSALQFYIVDIVHRVETELRVELKEGQDVLILVNNSLEKLIISILEVLAIVSPQKLDKIKQLSHNKRAIQEMITKAKVTNLFAQVKDNPLLLNMRNYSLEVAQYQEEHSTDPSVLCVNSIKLKDKSNKLDQIQAGIKKSIAKYTEEDITTGESWSMFHKRLCTCRKPSTVSSGSAIALLTDDGRGFALVTGSGCHLPNRGSSIFCPSLTAIIKSSPQCQNFGINYESSGCSLNTKCSPFLKNERNSLISSLIRKVNNSQRIMIGNKSAELKSHKNSPKAGKEKIPINKIIEEVFSKQSLISFASSRGNEELKLLFQPLCKGGLGMGPYILESESKSKTKKSVPVSEKNKSLWELEDYVIPQIIQQEKAIMRTAHIKQEIFASETRTKMKKFLLSDNPGPKI